MSMLGSLGQRLEERSLSERLDALAELVRIGRARQAQGRDDSSAGGFSAALLDDAESVLKRAGERSRSPAVRAAASRRCSTPCQGRASRRPV
jgi:hypothetical protein